MITKNEVPLWKNMHLPFQRLLSILGLAKENCSRLQMITVIPVL